MCNYLRFQRGFSCVCVCFSTGLTFELRGVDLHVDATAHFQAASLRVA